LINVALGFDTYLVMRHGQEPSAEGATAEAGPTRDSHAASKLGCYFCNDIVAATNSQRDRSLDQQCTVTRPGLSFIAAALGVELMVALMHASDAGAAGDVSAGGAESDSGSETGSRTGKTTSEAPVIPHQIRGSVAGFTQFTPHVSVLSLLCLSLFPLVLTLSGTVFLATDSSFRVLHGMLVAHRVCLQDSGLRVRATGM
jgi:ubiquitin-like modifier-activating enzyme ATG7